MAFLGLRGTGDWGTDERPKNFREMILWRHPNGSAPLTALMSKVGSESTDDPEFNWWEEEQNAVRVTGDATGASTTSTTLGLTSGGNLLVAGDVLLIEKTETPTYDNEIVLVSSVSSDTSIVIKRGQSGSTAANTGASPNLTRIGMVFAEGTNSPDVSANNPTKITNYCQIFKTAYELTETAKKTRTRTGDPLKNDKKRRMFQHSVAQEFAFLWGQKFEDTGSNGKPRRFTGGLREHITTNVTIFTADPTEDTFMDAIYPVFDYETEGSGGGNERLIFAGNVALNQLNRIARNSSSSRIMFDQVVRLYGMELQRWILPQGTVYVKTHPLLNTHGRFSSSMFVINPSSIKFRPLRDTMPQDNIQANDADTHKGQWLTETGLEIQHEKTMAYIGDFKDFP